MPFLSWTRREARACAVHCFGGTVIAASALISTEAAMPQATIDRDDAVDYVVSLGDIAGLLQVLSTARLLTPQAHLGDAGTGRAASREPAVIRGAVALSR
jgi:hypothetical protein